MIKPSTCNGCSLQNLGNSFSKSEGTGKNGVFICGEALGHEEAIEGLPFRPFAQAGSKLQECIEANGFSRNDFRLGNIVWCNPPYNKLTNQWYTQSAINHCHNNFLSAFASYIPQTNKSKIILALGNTAFQTLTGENHSVLDVRGYPFQANNLRIGGNAVIVVGSYHPSYIKRGNPELTPLLTWDIKKVVELASGIGYSEQTYKRESSYRIVGYDDAVGYFNHLKDNPRLVIAEDIETAESGTIAEDARDDLKSTEVTQIQYATDKYNAVIFPNFDPFYKKLAQKISTLPNLRLSWNGWKFDYPVLRNNGVQENDIGRCIDLMWAFKHYQPTLPRGLQAVACLAGFPFAWKHLFGADMELYGGADVCSLHFISEWLIPIMKSRGIWSKQDLGDKGGGGYTEYVQKLNPILHQASIEGLPVNDIARLELREKLIGMRDKLDAELQSLIPDKIKNIEPKRPIILKDSETGKEIIHISYGFKREPKEIRQASNEYASAVERLTTLGKRTGSFDTFVRLKYALMQRSFEDYEVSDTGEVKQVTVTRWCRIKGFKASKEQLSGYIRWRGERLAESKDKEERELSKLYKVPKDHEGKETTRKDEIEQLFEKTGDEVLQKNLEIRSLNTNINNYVPNWKPGLDGCVHTTFGYTAPSGQIDSRRPNVLNVSKHTDIGQLFRRIIEAPKGWNFVEFDKKSFHVATMGYCANDPTYIRFSQLDPHSIFTSYIMPKEWGKPIEFDMSDGEILERSKWIKKKSKQQGENGGIDLRQQQAKPTVLGNQLGLGPKKLYWQNRRSISGVEEAKKLQQKLADLFPKVEEWKENIQRIASKQTYLVSEFGYIQHFFDVINYRWDKKGNSNTGGWKEYEGGEARLPAAFLVQGRAFGMLKDELIRIEDRLIGNDIQEGVRKFGYFPFRNTIHDSLVFLFKNEDLERCIPICLEEMNKPCGKLVNEATGVEGLKVGVEYSIGRNWQNYHKINNLEGMREIS